MAGFADVSRTLFPPDHVRKFRRLDAVSLSSDGDGALHVAGYHMGEQQLDARYSEKDGTLSCTRDGIKIKNELSTETYMHDAEFANAEINSTHLLQDRSGNLVIKIDYTGAGMALILPWAYSGTRWVRLETSSPTTVPARRLTPEQATVLQNAVSRWGTIPGSTLHQMAAVFVESSVRAKAKTFEAEDLADQIAESLQGAGWDVDRNQVTYHFAFEGSGVGILTSSNTRGIEVGQELARMLNSVGVAATLMPQIRPNCEALSQAAAIDSPNPRCSQISIFVGYHP
jgi:hypothetical protein